MKEKKKKPCENEIKEMENSELSERASLAEVASDFIEPDIEDNDTDDIKNIVKKIRESDVVPNDIKEMLVESCVKADKIIIKTDGGKPKGKQEQRKGMTEDLQSKIGKNRENREVTENRENPSDEKNRESDHVQEI